MQENENNRVGNEEERHRFSAERRKMCKWKLRSNGKVKLLNIFPDETYTKD